MKTNFAVVLIGCAILSQPARGADFAVAAQAVNALGIDLYQKIAAGEGNVCLSPYSISCALAMTLDGADGETRVEMARVLHLDPEADSEVSFAALGTSLAEIGPKTARIAMEAKQTGGPSSPVTIALANRLFPQSGYDFRAQFFARVKENFDAVPEIVDFKNDPATATQMINNWVARQTRDRIRDLIPQPLDPSTRLVLANALYFKAPWATEFSANATKAETFHVADQEAVEVPTMVKSATLCYARRKGFSIVALPYSGGNLQFVILIPDQIDGVHELEKKLTPDLLASCAKLETSPVLLHLPKFKFAPPTVQLASELQALGMKTAFDIPSGSANFDRMASRRPENYLALSQVFHKTFIALDENGTEAAAATAVAMLAMASAVHDRTEPVEVKADRPFLYAIQHVPSGACLFLGRVTDPRP